MTYFDKDYFDFFKELAANNNKDWFDANRKRYENSVKKPFEKFISDLISEINKIDSKVAIQPKDAIFRINRDIRFSKDKTPYKLNRSAIVSPVGKKDKANPGLYVEISPEHCRVYGGVYMPDKHQLYNIRETIANEPKKLEKLMSDNKFKEVFGEVRGEKNKIIPKEFKEVGEKADIIYNKQFYWFTQFKPEDALKSDFMKKTMDAYKANKKLMDYFAAAMN
ncbi:MAG: DUF2461 domain-containing protein [Crocinitomicaceae bacterium]|nr:DUF2461 domain-containing protein [Crocinitomicaceae bacterium]